MGVDPLDRIALICNEQPHDALSQIAEVLGYADGVPLHRNHLPDLRYVLLTLERVTPTVKKDAELRGQVAAAINGMRYIIQRTEQAQCATPPADTRPEQEKKHLSAGEGGKENHG